MEMNWLPCYAFACYLEMAKRRIEGATNAGMVARIRAAISGMSIHAPRCTILTATPDKGTTAETR